MSDTRSGISVLRHCGSGQYSAFRYLRQFYSIVPFISSSGRATGEENSFGMQFLLRRIVAFIIAAQCYNANAQTAGVAKAPFGKYFI